MVANLKGDIVNDAYNEARISGLTSNPTPDEVEKALLRLESMAAQWEKKNIFVGYNFEDEPDINTPHNIPIEYWSTFYTNLAIKLLASFGKDPKQTLIMEAQSNFSFISSATAQVRELQYPSRMPIGHGTSARYGNNWQRFNQPVVEAPLGSATNKMIIGTIDDFVEHFDDYLKTGEDIESYVLEKDDGITIVSESLSTPDVNYQVSAVGNNDTSIGEFLQVKITATTTDGRVEIRYIDFELSDS